MLSEYFGTGKVAVITGASSGIGLAMSKKCALEFKMHVFCIDIDKEELEASVQSIKNDMAAGSDQKVEAFVADVSDYDSVLKVREKLLADGLKTIHFLFNNAGTGLGGGALSDLSTFQRVVNVNGFGVIHGCMAFVPLMKKSGEAGLIVNTGSKQGITAPPGNLAYNVSKSIVKTYSEGLEHELMKDRKTNGGILRSALLIPGWVNTSIALKATRSEQGKDFDIEKVPFHEEKPANGAWMPSQIVEFLLSELSSDVNKYYVICPDNDVDRVSAQPI